MLLGVMAAPARSQQALLTAVATNNLRASWRTYALPHWQSTTPQAPASITGNIVDQSGAPISGAIIKLTREDQAPNREALSDADGHFSFADLASGPFHLTISSPNLTAQTFDGVLHSGQTYTLPLVVLTVAAQVTNVRVGVTPAEIAEDQVKQEEHQRILGLVPNFYVSYVPNAERLSAKLKFQLAWKSSADAFTLLAVGAVAGVEQAANQWPGYGQGVQGYAKRYGATYADVAAATFIGSAALPALFRQDPRYFYRGTGSKRSRILHAIADSVLCKGDSGKWEPNYSNIGGALAAGGLANLYYPGQHKSAANVVLSTVLIRVGETAVANLFQEFLIPRLTPHLPSRAAGQP